MHEGIYTINYLRSKPKDGVLSSDIEEYTRGVIYDGEKIYAIELGEYLDVNDVVLVDPPRYKETGQFTIWKEPVSIAKGIDGGLSKLSCEELNKLLAIAIDDMSKGWSTHHTSAITSLSTWLFRWHTRAGAFEIEKAIKTYEKFRERMPVIKCLREAIATMKTAHVIASESCAEADPGLYLWIYMIAANLMPKEVK